MDAVSRARKLLLSPCKHIELVAFDAHDYQSVVNLWLSYKRSVSTLEKYPGIRSYFDFHRTHEPHLLMYSSKFCDGVLLMTKLENQYMNIRLPDLRERYLQSSFIAIYT